MSTNISVGYDPEFFPIIANSPATPYSPHTEVSGTKQLPSLVTGAEGTVQVDGIAVEFGASVPIFNIDHGIINFKRTLIGFRQQYPHLAFPVVSSRPVDPEWLAGLPESVRELGCDPDFSAYTGRANPRPSSSNLRTAAGHIHIGGLSGWNITARRRLIRNLDHTLGLFSVLCDPSPTRRLLYGKAGAFRPKSYGVEYRTPSNGIFRTPETLKFALRLAKVTAFRTGYGMWWGGLVAKRLINSQNPDRGAVRTHLRSFLRILEIRETDLDTALNSVRSSSVDLYTNWGITDAV